MNLKFSKTVPSSSKLVIVPFLDNTKLKQQLKKIVDHTSANSAWIKNFKAEASVTLSFFHSENQNQQWLLLGLGKQVNLATASKLFRTAVFDLTDSLPTSVSINLDFLTDHKNLIAKSAANGIQLNTYQIGGYKKKVKTTAKKINTLSFIDSDYKSLKADATEGKLLAETQSKIMALVDGPSNKITPQALAKWAQQSGKKHGFKVKVFNKAQIVKTKLGGLLAVNRGSEWPPTFTIMEYKPKGRTSKKIKKVALVGKGVTFDTGGISIKGSANMHYMKSDMGGAAAVLGTMEACAKLQLPVHLIGIVPSTDNCVDATSIKPGDVIDSYSGQTIEIIDTDAEGRLLLADGLAYVEKNYHPDIMIDLATLTGSAVRALGYQAAALFSNDDDLATSLSKSGMDTGERVWRLPLWNEYKKDIASDVADLRNFSGRPVAGAISAAKFLEAFTNQHPKWAHLDIAGVAFGNSPYSTQKSASGYGPALLIDWLKNL